MIISRSTLLAADMFNYAPHTMGGSADFRTPVRVHPEIYFIPHNFGARYANGYLFFPDLRFLEAKDISSHLTDNLSLVGSSASSYFINRRQSVSSTCVVVRTGGIFL